MDTPAVRAFPTALSLTAVAAGSAIYLLWRPESLLVFRWLSRAGLDGPVASLRNTAAGFGALLPEAVIYALPNALWAFALGLLLSSLWSVSRRAQVLLAAAGGAAVCLPELLQHPAIGIIPGTFDPADLVCLAGGWGVSFVFQIIFLRSVTYGKKNRCDPGSSVPRRCRRVCPAGRGEL